MVNKQEKEKLKQNFKKEVEKIRMQMCLITGC